MEVYGKYNDIYYFIYVNNFDFNGYDDISVQFYIEYEELGNGNLVKRKQIICDEKGDISKIIDVTP